MVIKIVGEQQIVCDCQGDTPDKYVDKLFVGIEETKDRKTVSVYCPECDSYMTREVSARLIPKLLPG